MIRVIMIWDGMVMHTFNPGIHETETEASG